MPGDNVVKIEFQADDSQVTAAFSKLNAEVSNLGSGGMSKAQSAMAGFSQATSIADSTVISFGKSSTTFGKLSGEMQASILGAAGSTKQLAAGTKAATTEQMAASVATGDFVMHIREAGEATEQLTQKTHGLISAYVAYRAIRAAYDVAKYAATESMEKESSEVRFKNLAGNTPSADDAYKALGGVEKKTGTNINELAEAETTLREAGLTGTEALTAATQALADKANVAKKPVGELADLYLKVATRGEVSGRELAMVAKLTGDESGKMAATYRDMTITIPQVAKELEAAHRVEGQERQDKETAFTRQQQDEETIYNRRKEDDDRAYAYQNKTGKASGDDTAAFRNAGGSAPSVKANQIKQFAKMYGISEADAEFYMAGSGAAAPSSAGEMRAGTDHDRESRQIAESRQREDSKRGTDRGREDERRGYERSYQDQITGLKEQAAQDKLALAETVKNGLLGTTPASQDQTKREGGTQAAHTRQAANEVKNAAQGAGDGLRGLSAWIDGLTKSLTGFDRAAHPVKGSEMPVHVDKAKKPGEPGYDYSQYKPPAGNTNTEKSNNESVVKAITGVIETLNRIFVSDSAAGS